MGLREVARGATRRQVLWTLGGAALAAGAPAAPPEVDAQVVARNDAALERLLARADHRSRAPAAGRRAGRVRNVPCGVGRRPDRDRGSVVGRAAIEAPRRAAKCWSGFASRRSFWSVRRAPRAISICSPPISIRRPIPDSWSTTWPPRRPWRRCTAPKTCCARCGRSW